MMLHEQNKLKAARAQVARSEILRFRSYLDGPKFQGHDARDGQPNNYINTTEVNAHLLLIDSILNGGYDDVINGD